MKITPQAAKAISRALDKTRTGPAKPDCRALLEKAVEALEFYGRKANWTWDIAPDPAGTPIPGTSPIEGDYGNLARTTLSGIKTALDTTNGK